MGDPLTNAFGEKRQSSWAWLWKPGKGKAPRRYAGAAGALGPISGLLMHKGDGLDGPTRIAIFVFLTVVPPLLVERWWQARERHRDEMVLPERSTG